MYGDSEVMSDRTPSVHMGLDDNLSSPTLESMSEGSSVSNKEPMSNPPFEEARPFRRRPREIFLLND